MVRTTTKITIAVTLLCCLLLSAPGATGQKLDKNVFKSIHYREIGPTRQRGRFVDFAWTAKEPKTFYAATASGHLWKTVNNGVTFEAIFTNEKVYSIGDVAVAPSDPKIVWVGTGEANTSRSS